MTVLTLAAVVNERLRHAGHRLHVEIVGRCITVHDDICLGLSFALPIDTPHGRIVREAIEGVNRRRAFVLGNSGQRKAA